MPLLDIKNWIVGGIRAAYLKTCCVFDWRDDRSGWGIGLEMSRLGWFSENWWGLWEDAYGLFKER